MALLNELIKILNVHGPLLFARKVHLFFYAFKTFVKYEILNNYVDRCYEANCVTCHIVAVLYYLPICMDYASLFFDV